MDSNFQYAGAVNLVVGPFGWVVLCDRVRSGRRASGTVRYQRQGWAILTVGLGAAHLRSDFWCARMGSIRSGDRLFSAASNDIRCTVRPVPRSLIRRAHSVPEEQRCRQPPLWTWQHADISANELYGGDLDPVRDQCRPMERVLRPHREAVNRSAPFFRLGGWASRIG